VTDWNAEEPRASHTRGENWKLETKMSSGCYLQKKAGTRISSIVFYLLDI